MLGVKSLPVFRSRRKSMPTGAPYKTLQIKNGCGELNLYKFVSRTWFFSCICASFDEAGRKRSKAVHSYTRIRNMI
jgi:hypothetical protein